MPVVSKQMPLKSLYTKPPHMNITERVRDIFNRYNVNLEVTEQDRTEMAEATLITGLLFTDAESFEGAEAYIINDEAASRAITSWPTAYEHPRRRQNW